MSQTIQAKCPHCQHVLTIPAEWVSKAMRCKHCKKTFQAKANSSKSANVPTAAPASSAKSAPAKGASIPVGVPATGVAAGSPPIARNPFAGVDEPAPGARRRKQGNGLLLLVVMFFFLFLLGAGGAGFVVYKALTMAPIEKRTIAQNEGGKTEYTPVRPVVPATDGSSDRKKTNTDGVTDKSKDGASKDGNEPPIVTPPPKTDPPKKTPPKKTPPVKEPKDGIAKKPPVFTNDAFPRRALLISVNNYLYYNTVHYGSGQDSFKVGYPGSSTSVLRDRFSRPPMNFPATQVVELSDGVPMTGKVSRAHSTQKSVIEGTIKDFLDASREQDRIVVFYAGHATSIEDKSYLVPIDGDTKDPATLLPLKWVYDQLASCKAQQKILILDAFRFSPSRGFELPGTGDGDEGTMPEAFDKDLQSPPAGVQVWSACVKEQASVELEGGSAFMQALCHSLQGGGEMKGLSSTADPIPIENLVNTVNTRLKELVDTEKRTQLSRLSGKASETKVAYNRDEPLPPVLSLRPPVVAGGKRAPKAQVNSILEVFRSLTPVRETRATDISLLDADKLPAFSEQTLDGYKADKEFAELRKRYKDAPEAFAKEFPMRAAVFDAMDAMQKSQGVKLREVLTKADADPKRKAQMRLEQEPIGKSTFELEQVLYAMKEAGEKRDVETSKRWQANFDYTQARLQSRLIYLIEYNYLLGRVLADDVPELAPGQSGWRIGAGKKIAVTEKKAKDYAKDTKKLWDRIVKDYPDTPWSLLAVREKEIALGLQWRPKSD